MANDERAALVLEEARRKLDQQQQVLDNLRARTGILLAAASIASGFVGTASLKNGWCVWGWLGFTSFLGFGVVAIGFVLWPQQSGWTFSHNVPKLLDYIEKPKPEDGTDWTTDEMRIAMAEDAQTWWVANAKRLDSMFTAFRWSAVLLLAEVAFWLADLRFCG